MKKIGPNDPRYTSVGNRPARGRQRRPFVHPREKASKAGFKSGGKVGYKSGGMVRGYRNTRNF